MMNVKYATPFLALVMVGLSACAPSGSETEKATNEQAGSEAAATETPATTPAPAATAGQAGLSVYGVNVQIPDGGRQVYDRVRDTAGGEKERQVGYRFAREDVDAIAASLEQNLTAQGLKVRRSVNKDGWIWFNVYGDKPLGKVVIRAENGKPGSIIVFKSSAN